MVAFNPGFKAASTAATAEDVDFHAPAAGAAMHAPADDELDGLIAEARAQVEMLPINDPKRTQLLNDLNARSMLSANAVSNIRTEASNEIMAQNGKEGEKIRDDLSKGVMALAGGALAFSELEHLTDAGRPHGHKLLDSGLSTEVASLSNAAHFTPVVTPGMQVAVMQNIAQGQGVGARALPGRSGN